MNVNLVIAGAGEHQTHIHRAQGDRRRPNDAGGRVALT